MTPLLKPVGFAILGGVLASASLQAAEPDKAGVEFFEKKIRPLLVQNCYECHSTKAGKSKGGLLVDSREGLLKGGESGAAIVPGDVEGSLLVEAIHHQGLEMPPNNKLPDDAIALLEKWVSMGAPDPRTAKAKAVAALKKGIDIEEGRKFWAFQAPQKTAPPVVATFANWVRSDIDRFLAAQWASQGLTPVADADRHTLLRRVSLALTGLPPTPEEVQEFVRDESPQAWETVVDRLLDSPQFGERWGRHWLDVSRYAESTGKERNIPFPYAWRYRDYVIDAFTQDKPYDRFLMEQIAGDLLPAETPAQRNMQQVATGFLTLGPKSVNERNRLQYIMDEIDEQIDVTCRAILATTVSCARCHDHKFDPIATRDYYSLAGIFRSTSTYSGVTNGKRTSNDGDFTKLADLNPKPVDPALREKYEALASDLEKAQAQFQKQAANAKKNKNKANKQEVAAEAKALKAKISGLQSQLKELGYEPPAPALAMGVQDASAITNCRICIRGEVDELGDEVPRGLVPVMVKSAPTIPADHSGRLELAQWIVSRENPLTARVMVNRIWHHLFGVGLVSSVDNFGVLGERPSHPELLDHLAVQFMDEEWSVKQMIRTILLSHAYQLSSQHSAANYAVDPDNRSLWRMNRRRLDAESIRDSALFVSGQLNLERPEGSPIMKVANGEIGRNVKLNESDLERTHRSVYLPLVRNEIPEMLGLFDVADPSLVVGQREVTTVATQALFMMNSPFIMEQATAVSKRLLQDAKKSDDDRITLAFQLCFGRPPLDTERQQAASFLSKFSDGKNTAAAWSNFCQVLLSSAEFRYMY